MKELTIIQSYLDSNEYESVNKIWADYNELFNSIDINIFWDRKKSIEMGLKFNSVVKRTGSEIEKELKYILENFRPEEAPETLNRMTGPGQINPDIRGIRPGQTDAHWMRSQDELDLEKNYPPMSISDFNKDIEEAVKKNKKKLT